MNLSVITNFPLLCVEYIFIYISCNHDHIDLLQNSLSLSTNILSGFLLDYFKIFWNVIVIPFLFFKGMTQSYLLLIAITHSKNLNPKSFIKISCISVKSVPKILSIKGEFTFLLLNFIIIGFCYSFDNSLLGIFSLLIPLLANLFAHAAKVYLSKKL